MQSKSRMINKLALVFLSIIVLELVLIRDQVQPVKAIKKKILLKKLKKLLPLMALLKPKKKIILVPIPFPMFKDKPGHHAYGQHGGRRPMAMSMVAADATPSYMEAGDQPVLVGLPVDGSPPIQMLPMSMSPTSIEPIVASMMGQSGGANASAPMSPMMMMPSMTLSIQTDAGGTSSAVQLSAHSASNSSLANLQRRPPANKYHHQQQPLDDWTEHYYSPSWAPARPSLASPAKLLRNQKHRKPEQQQQQHYRQAQPQQQPQVHEWRQSNQLRLLPMLVRQSPAGKVQQQPIVQQQQRQPIVQQVQLMQQHIQQALEQEDLVAVGPAKLVPVYQSPSGELHMSPPTGEREETVEPAREGQSGGAELNSEVQTVGQPARLADTPTRPPRVSEQPSLSPAVKGKQRQQQQQLQPKGQLNTQY